jgi:hypothetical protein
MVSTASEIPGTRESTGRWSACVVHLLSLVRMLGTYFSTVPSVAHNRAAIPALEYRSFMSDRTSR